MMPWQELLAVLASFVGTAFGLIRYALNLNRSMTDRFVTFLEGSIRRQEDINRGFQEAIDQLAISVKENSHLMARIAERLGSESCR
jgi:hypothetical protein